MDNYLAVKTLWLSVILQAISDYYSESKSNFSGIERRSAIKWLFCGDRGWNGFIALCGYFNIDYRSIRRTLSKCKSMRQFKDAMNNVESDAVREERILDRGMIFWLGSHAKSMPAVFNRQAED